MNNTDDINDAESGVYTPISEFYSSSQTISPKHDNYLKENGNTNSKKRLYSAAQCDSPTTVVNCNNKNSNPLICTKNEPVQSESGKTDCWGFYVPFQ